MTIPGYQSIMLPLLRLAGDGRELRTRDAIELLAAEFGLTADERKQLLPSGQARTWDNRVNWAATYLRKAEVLETPRRGYIAITDRGRNILA